MAAIPFPHLCKPEDWGDLPQAAQTEPFPTSCLHSGTSAAVAQAAPQAATADKYPWPPGFAGHLADFIYHSSYLPVREVAIAATLGLLAGVCGRAFIISGKNPSLYIILVARSGIGKEGMHEGIHKMVQLADVPGAVRFLNASDFASGPALHKALLTQPGFLNLQGEFGRKLKRMSNSRDTPMQDLRTVMTNAFGKQFLDGKSYSDGATSILGVEWPALSFLGETTPGTFYEALTPDMMADGFMSRFLVISHTGDRPQPNESRLTTLEPGALAKWKAIVVRALPYHQSVNMPPPIEVEYENGSACEMLRQFGLECGDGINAAGDDELKRQMLNRAHVKALNIAALLAVADNEVMPKISLEHAAWAINVVRNDIAIFSEKISSGDIGMDDHARESKLLAVLIKYLTTAPSTSYKIPPGMREEGIVPRKYLQQNVSSASAFLNHKLGATAALDLTVRSLVDSGYLHEVEKSEMAGKYKAVGKCYRIVSLP